MAVTEAYVESMTVSVHCDVELERVMSIIMALPGT